MKRLFAFIAMLLMVGCSAPPEPSPFVAGTPVEILEDYYAAWAIKDYKTMYFLVSDGWKALESTAHTEEDFAEFLDGFYDNAKGLRLTFASEQYNTGSEATVSFALEVELYDGSFLNNDQTLTLRLKKNGWKLIHPYGDYADLS